MRQLDHPLTDIERPAYHEAGHVVANCLLHVGFTKASIVETDDYRGIVSGGRVPE
jgi:hypothetical protein